MSTESEFAEALSEALGPLYRISVVGADGSREATFRTSDEHGVGAPVARVGLPGSSSCLEIEVDLTALRSADRVLHGLARASGDAPIGLPNLDRALEELIAAGEGWIGRPTSQMNRLEKQQLVKFLDERGAFSLRKSVEAVASMLGVSRFTVYNYLDASRGP